MQNYVTMDNVFFRNCMFGLYGILFASMDLQGVRMLAVFMITISAMNLIYEYGKYIARGRLE